MLINDILDLSKIESGTVVVDVSELRLDDLHSYVERTFRHVAESKSVDFVIQLDAAAAAGRCSPTPSACSRSSRTCCPTPSSSRTTGQVTLHGRAGAQRLDARQRGAEPRPPGAGLLGGRHRHRHPAGQAADHLRGVPAGRRHDQPQVRRHRPGPGDQPRAVAACWAARSAWSARPAQGSTFTLYLPQIYTPRARGAARPRPRPATHPRPSRQRWMTTGPAHAAADDAARGTTPYVEADEAATAGAEPVPCSSTRPATTATTSAPGDRVLLIVENDLASPGSCSNRPASKGFKGLVTRSAPPPWP